MVQQAVPRADHRSALFNLQLETGPARDTFSAIARLGRGKETYN